MAEGDCGNVDVRGFSHWLMVKSGIGNDKETRLSEFELNLIGQGSWGVTSSNSLSASVFGELRTAL